MIFLFDSGPKENARNTAVLFLQAFFVSFSLTSSINPSKLVRTYILSSGKNCQKSVRLLSGLFILSRWETDHSIKLI